MHAPRSFARRRCGGGFGWSNRKLTRRVEELRPYGVLERLWLLGFLGRTIYPRDFGGQPARFLEFFHANLSDYLLQLMGQGGGEIELPRRRCETPPAWRALDRLSIAAHEWEQTQQLLPADDVAFLMEQREVTVERNERDGESRTAAFYLLFLHDIEEARPRLCKAASECFAFSALVHDNLGRWAVERLFGGLEERIECCKSWLERCARDSRAPILPLPHRVEGPGCAAAHLYSSSGRAWLTGSTWDPGGPLEGCRHCPEPAALRRALPP